MAAFTPDHIPDLAGKTVIVTGANSGIGHAAAAALASAGATVVLAVRDQAKGEAAAADHAGNDRGPPARPRQPRLGARLRGRLAGRHRPADQQRRGDDPAAEPHRRRLRAAVRHQPPRPLRPHQPPAAARRRHRPRRHGVVRRPPGRRDRLRRPQLGAQAVPALARLRPVEAGQPALHQRASAAPDRGRIDGARRPPPTPATPPPISSRTAAAGWSRSRWSSSATA